MKERKIKEIEGKKSVRREEQWKEVQDKRIKKQKNLTKTHA